jgi:hypothetical protein
MNITSLKLFASQVFSEAVNPFNQYAEAFDDRTMSQAQTVMTRIQQATLDPDLYKVHMLPTAQKLIRRIVEFVDDTQEARDEIEIFVVSSMKCGYIISLAEKEFSWSSLQNAIPKQSETLLSATADALVRESARKNYHYLQGQLRVLGIYCGYLIGRISEQVVSTEIDSITYVLSVGPR